jgi:hypothetical protein
MPGFMKGASGSKIRHSEHLAKAYPEAGHLARNGAVVCGVTVTSAYVAHARQRALA